MLPLTAVLVSFLSFSYYVLKCVVVYRTGRFALNILRAIYVYYVAPILGLGVDFKRYERRWTVITGCTDGIGHAYLFALAERGLRKFILISRSPEKLKETSNRLMELHADCRVETFAFTFGQDSYAKLKTFLLPFDIGILVNNVGDAPRVLQRFGDDYETDKRVSNVNTKPAFELIQMVLPKMKLAKEGIIVNMSSSQSIRPVPLLTAYSASKVYLAYLSECLHHEYSSDGITVQCLAPLLVATKLVYYKTHISSIAKYFVVSPEEFARQAVSSLGVVSYTMGCFNHEIQKSFLYLLPWWILRHLVAPIYKRQQARLMAIHRKQSGQKLSNGCLQAEEVGSLLRNVYRR